MLLSVQMGITMGHDAKEVQMELDLLLPKTQYLLMLKLSLSYYRRESMSDLWLHYHRASRNIVIYR